MKVLPSGFLHFFSPVSLVVHIGLKLQFRPKVSSQMAKIAGQSGMGGSAQAGEARLVVPKLPGFPFKVSEFS